MDLLDALLSPLGFGVPLALALWWTHGRIAPALWRGALLIEMICIVLSTPLGAGALVRLEEQRASPPSACAAPQPTTVVLLAGGARRVARAADDDEALHAASLRRTLAAVALMRRLNGAQLVITGTSDNLDAPVSVLMADLARQLGVPAAAIRTETTARTTWQNAQRVSALDPPLPKRIWLVSSALHLPRAMVAFRAAGFEPCAYPSAFLSTPFDGPRDLLPGGVATSNAEAALHELVGELLYRMRAWRQPRH